MYTYQEQQTPQILIKTNLCMFSAMEVEKPATVVFLRTESESKVHIQLVGAKSGVAPIKLMSNKSGKSE